MAAIQYPINPEEALKLEHLKELPEWQALLRWLDQQEESLINHLKLNAVKSLTKAGLTAAEVTGALKQVGRLRSLPELVENVLKMYRKQAKLEEA